MREAELTDLEREKYRRQIMIFGEEGQRRLKGAGALVTRVGGLGGPTALYLAAAGIGRLVIAHAGKVTLSNLNRQILMTHDWVGKERIVKAVESIKRLNPDVEVIPVGGEGEAGASAGEHPSVRERAVTRENIDGLVEMVDVICDCAPTFEERFLLNEAAIRHKKPMVEAAMYGMEAHLTVIIPGETPCLRCLYPEDPEWHIPFPVLGAVSGSLGCLAAIEAIKLITGYGKPLAGELLVYDTTAQNFQKYRVRRDPNCPVCGGVRG